MLVTEDCVGVPVFVSVVLEVICVLTVSLAVKVVVLGVYEVVLLVASAELLLVVPVAVRLVELELLEPPDVARAFLSVLILCALTPARVASTGAANMLITDATNIAQKKEALDGR